MTQPIELRDLFREEFCLRIIEDEHDGTLREALQTRLMEVSQKIRAANLVRGGETLLRSTCYSEFLDLLAALKSRNCALCMHLEKPSNLFEGMIYRCTNPVHGGTAVSCLKVIESANWPSSCEYHRSDESSINEDVDRVLDERIRTARTLYDSLRVRGARGFDLFSGDPSEGSITDFIEGDK